MTRVIYLSLCVFISLSCKDDCPEEYLFTKDEVPSSIRSAIKYWDVTDITLISEEMDTVVFNRYRIDRDLVTKDLMTNAVCEEDETQIVKIYYERVKNAMFYAAGQDTLAFQFHPRKPSMGRFDYREYDLIEEKGILELPEFYQNFTIKLGSTQLSITSLVKEKKSILNNYLPTNYELLNQSFKDVYYWDINEPVIIYFSDDHGFVGLKDLDGKKWIRLI